LFLELAACTGPEGRHGVNRFLPGLVVFKVRLLVVNRRVMPKRGFTGSRYGRAQKRARKFIQKAASRAVVRARRVVPFRRRVSLDYHAFSRYQEAFDISTTATSEGFTYSFALIDVINYTEFTAMFDQYKIHKVVFKIQMVSNPDAFLEVNGAVNSQNQTNWYPKIWYIRDYDAGGAETLSSIKERVGAKFFIMRPNKEVSITLKPCVAVQTYKTLTAAGYGPKRMWVDCANADVPHYGLQLVTDCLGNNPVNSFKFRVDVKFYLGFKGVR
jgi:hypothetical protein